MRLICEHPENGMRVVLSDTPTVEEVSTAITNILITDDTDEKLFISWEEVEELLEGLPAYVGSYEFYLEEDV